MHLQVPLGKYKILMFVMTFAYLIVLKKNDKYFDRPLFSLCISVMFVIIADMPLQCN